MFSHDLWFLGSWIQPPRYKSKTSKAWTTSNTYSLSSRWCWPFWRRSGRSGGSWNRRHSSSRRRCTGTPHRSWSWTPCIHHAPSSSWRQCWSFCPHSSPWCNAIGLLRSKLKTPSPAVPLASDDVGDAAVVAWVVHIRPVTHELAGHSGQLENWN